MAVSRDQFARQVVESSLMSSEDIAAAEAEARPSQRPRDGQQLARLLVKQKALTAFQAQRIYARKGKSLVLGNYVLLDELGRGGMGIVFKAEHRRMKRVVALKVLSPTVTKSAALTRRFQREVEAAAKLEHPHIVNAHDADEANGSHFLVMQYIEGTDLAAKVKSEGRLPLDKALACVLQAARGLEYAHRRGVIHRDIKPANLLLDREGTVRILDMGLARLDSAGKDQDQLTGTGQIMGTVDYMAPEQAIDTKAADARADIYSLGVTLWYLLTGRPLYAGETAVMRLMAHQNGPIPSLRDACPHVSPELDAAFAKMIAKSPESRYQNMTEVIADLERCTGESAVAPSVATPPGDDSRFSEFLRGMESAGGPTMATRSVARKKVAWSADEPTVTIPVPEADTDTDPQLQETLINPLPPTRIAPAGRMPRPPWWRNRGVLIAGGMAVPLFLWGLLVLFVQTDEGTIRLEINDPDIEVAIKGTEILLEQADGGKNITLSPGEKTLIVQRGDFQFETDEFLLRDGETVIVRVELLDGKIEVRQGEKLLGAGQPPARVAPRPAQVAATSPVDPDRRAAEWVLSIGGSVHVNGEERELDEVSELPPDRFRLTGINLAENRQVNDAGLARCEDCVSLSYLNLVHTPVSDAGLAFFRDCTQLSCLYLTGTPVTDVGLARFQNLTNLTHLSLFDTRISDAGLAHLRGCKKLRHLSLRDTKITDEGLTHLAGMTALEGVSLHGTRVTPEAAGELHKKIPHCILYLDSGTIEPVELAASPPTNHVLQFDGQQDYVELTTLKLPRGPITLELWVSPRIGEKPLTLLNGIGDAGATIYLRPTVGFCAAFQRGIIYENVNRTNGTGCHHVALVFDGTVFQLFVDGVPSGKTSTKTPDATPEGISFLGAEQNWVEKANDKPNLNRLFAGRLDEVRISTIARYTGHFTPSRRFVPDEHTLALYHCDEGQGKVLKDSSGHGHHGKIVGATWVPQDPMNAAMAADNPDRRAAEWVLSIGGTVRINNEDRKITDAKTLPPADFQLTGVSLEKNQQVTEAGLAHFEGCKNLVTLRLNGTQVGDAGLAHFQGCTELTILYLGGTKITNKGLAYFQDCKKLTYLDLNDTEISDAGLAHFKDRKNLTHLFLGGTNVTDAGLAYFQNCKQLLVVWLYGTDITDAGLAHFQGCKNLAALNLHDTEVGDAGLAYFEGRGNMRYLDLRDTQITDAGLAYFQDCKNLDLLDLRNTKISDAGLVQFQDYKNLSILLLSGTQVSDAGLAHLQNCENLSILWLEEMKITDAGLKRLSGLPKLGELHLHHTPVTTQGVGDLHKQLPQCTIYWDGDTFKPQKLPVPPVVAPVDAATAAVDPDRRAAEWVLSIGGQVYVNHDDDAVTDAKMLPPDGFQLTGVFLEKNWQLTDEGLAHFQGCQHLTYLVLSSSNISDTGLAYFKECKDLMHLGMFSTQVGDAGLAHFKGCENLTYLNVSHTQITDASLAYFKNLSSLKIVGTRVTDAGLANIQDCKNLSLLELWSTKITDAGLAHLAGLAKLRELQVHDTQVTAQGVADLHKKLPHCGIHWDGGVITPE